MRVLVSFEKHKKIKFGLWEKICLLFLLSFFVTGTFCGFELEGFKSVKMQNLISFGKFVFGLFKWNFFISST